MIKYLIAFLLIASPCLAGMGIGGFPQPGPGVVMGSTSLCSGATLLCWDAESTSVNYPAVTASAVNSPSIGAGIDGNSLISTGTSGTSGDYYTVALGADDFPEATGRIEFAFKMNATDVTGQRTLISFTGQSVPAVHKVTSSRSSLRLTIGAISANLDMSGTSTTYFETVRNCVAGWDIASNPKKSYVKCTGTPTATAVPTATQSGTTTQARLVGGGDSTTSTFVLDNIKVFSEYE